MDMKTTEHPIDRAARIVGGRAQLASMLNVTVQAVGNWVTRGIPLDHCPYIEQFTAGAVTCEDMRPDKVDYFARLRSRTVPIQDQGAA